MAILVCGIKAWMKKNPHTERQTFLNSIYELMHGHPEGWKWLETDAFS